MYYKNTPIKIIDNNIKGGKVKFTFKTTKPSGKYASFYKSLHDIKLKKKIVGSISSVEPYTISFMVLKDILKEDDNPNCIWEWVRLKKEFNSIQDAKNFINEHAEKILLNFNLYLNK